MWSLVVHVRAHVARHCSQSNQPRLRAPKRKPASATALLFTLYLSWLVSRRRSVLQHENGKSTDDEEQPQSCHKAKEQAPSAGNLSDDCLLNILTNLPVCDLNSIAMVNRRFREARSHKLLAGQARSAGAIVLAGS